MKPSRFAASVIGLGLAMAIPLTVSLAASTVIGRDADQYFVILSTSKDRSAAMLKSRGWVLETSLYSKLGQGWYANVVGPFKNATEAKKRLADIKSFDKNSTAYVKNAGRLQLPMFAAWNTPTMPPALIAAFLGSLDLIIEHHQGGQNGCEPQDPYYTITVKQIKGEPSYDQKTDRLEAAYSFENALVGKGLTMDEKTGEIHEMYVCLE